MKRTHVTRRQLGTLASIGAIVTACGPSYVRGSEEPGLDDPAMSTGLDKRDLQRALNDQLESFRAARAFANLQAAAERPRISIFPLANETSEHVDSALDALLSDVETWLVETDVFDVVSVERQRQMMAEIAKQQGGGFDPQAVAAVNAQLGTQFYFTGKVFNADERTEDARRVQYFMFMQLIEVATSAVRWQHKTEITKAILD
ncbi:MAG: penicillin-binding protein activator LpoB [Myxococcota bacterium]